MLLNFIKEQYEEDEKIRGGESARKVRKGYIGHIIEICQKIVIKSQENTLLQEKFMQSTSIMIQNPSLGWWFKIWSLQNYLSRIKL